jgi:hypothetical protein
MPGPEKKYSRKPARKAAGRASKEPQARAGAPEDRKKKQRRTRSSLSRMLPGQPTVPVGRPGGTLSVTKPVGKSPVESLKRRYLKTVCRVTFKLPGQAASFASQVNLVGDFNGWNREATPMKKLRDGSFSVTLSLPKGRAYHFRYLIDGLRWENDWCADTYAPNPFAGDNSVVIV